MLKWLAILGLAILVLVLATAQKPLPVEGNNQQNQSQGKTNETQPDAQAIATSEINKENAANAERYAYYKAHPKEYFKTAFAPANLSNWVLAGLGVIGGLLALSTLCAIKRQAYLMEKTLVMQFRPKLIIRGIDVVPQKYRETNLGTRQVDEDVAWNVECVIANTGGTVAHVMESNVTVSKIGAPGERLPAIPPYGSSHNCFGEFDIGDGEQRTVRFALSPDDTMRFKTAQRLLIDSNINSVNNYCLGFIYYRDDVGTCRRTAFCLLYDSERDCFDRVDNPNYEYSD